MSDSRVIAWFSCGGASAVAAKLAIEKYGTRAVIVHCDTLASEHPDNRRFFDDVQAWLGREIVTIRSTEYNTIDDVFEATRFLASINGARCTTELKKNPRTAFQLVDDIHIFGYTADEQRRIQRFKKSNPELRLDWILANKGYTKKWCFRILEQAGIKLPEIYSLGFENANCLGCVKASSPHYWARVRRLFPDVFARRADQSRRFGARLTRINSQRVFIDEIPPDNSPLWDSIEQIQEDLSCGPQCESYK